MCDNNQVQDHVKKAKFSEPNMDLEGTPVPILDVIAIASVNRAGHALS